MTGKDETISEVDWESLKGWEKLSGPEKVSVKREHTALGGTLERLGKDWIAVGTHLKELRSILARHGIFDRYVKLRPYGLSRATVNRRIRLAEKARRALRPDLLQFALLNGLDRIDVEAVKVIPPPKTSNPKEMTKYLKAVSERTASIVNDPEIMKRECINFIRLRWERLPEDWTGAKKSSWMKSVCGMAMTLIGVSSEQSIAPVAIPIDAFRKSGRPATREVA